MADLPISLDRMKRFLNAQIHDPQKWEFNMRFLRAAGMFAGSVILVRNFGDFVAV